MRYLYGDSTEFPLNENFIETAAAATDAAVALLTVDELVSRARKVSEDADAAAVAEINDIDDLAKRVEKALGARERLSNATAKLAEEVAQTAKSQFDRARAGVKAWREATVRKAAAGTGATAVMEPLQRFLTRHQLPYSSWGLRWKAGHGEEPVQAQAYAIMQRGLAASLSIAIPERHLWSQPVRVAQLERGLALHMIGRTWLGKDRVVEEQLDKYFITHVTRTNEREALVLSRRPKDPSAGLLITFRDGDKTRVTAVRLDDDEHPCGDAVPLQGADADTARRLWAHVRNTIADLVVRRHHLLTCTLHGKPVTQIESPGAVAAAIVQSVAPLVRDMGRHSSTSGELQLKRDLGDGRREELFIHHGDITRKYANLTHANQRLFEMYGLGARDASDSAPATMPLATTQSTPAPQLSPLALELQGKQRAAATREERRAETVRRVAEEVRRLAGQTRGPIVPTGQPMVPSERSESLVTSVPPPSAPPRRSRSSAPTSAPPPPVSRRAPRAETMPDPALEEQIPPPPAVPAEVRGEATSDRFRIPPPSTPPPRRSTKPRPNLRVVNG
jgi:hypothetical protein